MEPTAEDAVLGAGEPPPGGGAGIPVGLRMGMVTQGYGGINVLRADARRECVWVGSHLRLHST